MPSVTTTECTTEASIEMNITYTTNWYTVQLIKIVLENKV